MMMSGGQNELSEPGLTYQRADGTVEHAVDMQDAISRCPVLGRLALADPNQLGVLMDLAAIGNEKMAADVGDEPLLLPEVGVQTYAADIPEAYESSYVDFGREAAVSEPTFSVTEVEVVAAETTATSVESSVENSTSVTDIDESTTSEQTIAATATVTDHGSDWSPDVGYEVANSVSEKVVTTEPKHIHTMGAAAVSSVIAPQRPEKEPVQKAPLAQPIVPLKKPELKKEIPLQSKMSVLPDAPATPIVAPVMSVVLAEIGSNNGSDKTEAVMPAQKESVESPVIEAVESNEESLAHQLLVESSDELTKPSGTELDQSSEIIDFTPVTNGEEVVPLPMVEQPEKEFTPECIEIFQQLMVMESTEVEPDVVSVMYPLAVPEQLVALLDTTDGTTNMLTEETTEAPAISVFEDLIESIIDKEDISVTFESMAELAYEDQQPLVRTFIQLAGIMKNPVEHQPEYRGVYKALVNIKKQLHGFTKSNDAENDRPQLTMELTEKLIELLRALGYEDPKNVLIEFVAEYGISRLLMTLEHLCLLRHDDYAQESLLVSVAASTVSDTEATRARIAKALFGITAKINYAPGI